MSTFDLAIPSVLLDEGGYANDPKDPGGATKCGISIRFLRDLYCSTPDAVSSVLHRTISSVDDVTITDIQNLTPDAIKSLYKIIWDGLGVARINAQKVATKLFNLAVNMGDSEAVKVLQRALWTQYDISSLADDGILGNTTISYVNNANADCLLCAMRAEAASAYRLIIARNPNLEHDEKGLLKRAYE